MAAATLAPMAVHSSSPRASVSIATSVVIGFIAGRTGQPPGVVPGTSVRVARHEIRVSDVCYRGAVGLGRGTGLGDRGGVGHQGRTTPVPAGAAPRGRRPGARGSPSATR